MKILTIDTGTIRLVLRGPLGGDIGGNFPLDDDSTFSFNKSLTFLKELIE